jgi:NAD(P)-dependent dehydrogenase (short-subunit alcohol dehydrogenase family)
MPFAPLGTDYQNLSDRNILVTGGTTGIGRSVLVALAAQGANLITCGRDQQDLASAIEAGSKAGGRVHGVQADLANVDDVRRLFSEVDRHFDKLDILINNAAVYGTEFEAQDLDSIDYVIRTNVVGYVACAREAVQRMKKSKRGHVVLVGSMSADLREEEGSTYVATKGAIQAFAESLRKTVNQDGIKVTLIEPGQVATDMVEKSDRAKEKAIDDLKMLRPEDIAATIVFALMQPERCDIVSLQVRPHLQVI